MAYFLFVPRARTHPCASTLTCLGVAHHLHTTTVAGHQGRLITGQRRVIEGVLATRIRPRVTFVAVNGAGCTVHVKIVVNISFKGED